MAIFTGWDLIRARICEKALISTFVLSIFSHFEYLKIIKSFKEQIFKNSETRAASYGVKKNLFDLMEKWVVKMKNEEGQGVLLHPV